MKSHDAIDGKSLRQPASSPHKSAGDASPSEASAPAGAQRSDIDRSPRMLAQRRAIDATLGDARQRRSDAGGETPHMTPVNETGMPDQLKAGIESLSGMDLSAVRVHHNSAKPAQLNAKAYAQGSDIHLGPGQEQHLPHEAWHVVQQRRGQVRPTMQLAGVNVNDDTGLEREADQMGRQAVLQRAAIDAGDRRSASDGARALLEAVVQREKSTFQSNDGHSVEIDTDAQFGNEDTLDELIDWATGGKLADPVSAKAELTRLHGLAIGENKQELFEALHRARWVGGSAMLAKAASALKVAIPTSYDDIESMIGWYDVNHLKGPEGVSARKDMDSVIGGDLMVKVPGVVHKNLAARAMDRAAFHKQLADEVWAESHPGVDKEPVTLFRLFSFDDWGKEAPHPNENHYNFGRGIADSWTRSKEFAEAWGEGKGHRSIMRMTFDGSVPGYHMSFAPELAETMAEADYSKKWNQNELEILIGHGTFKLTHTVTTEVEEGPAHAREKVKVHYFDAQIV